MCPFVVVLSEGKKEVLVLWLMDSVLTRRAGYKNTVKKHCTSLARTSFENRLNSAPFYPCVYCQLAVINARFLIDGYELLKVSMSLNL